MAESTSPHTKPRRRWVQFSLRTLFLLVCLVCVLAAAVSYFMWQGRKQQMAVDAILQAGGNVYYDYQMDEQYSEPNTLADAQPADPWPPWIESFLGHDTLYSVAAVDFSTPDELGEEAFTALGALRGVKFLFLSSPSVSDDSLRHLAHWHSLETLILRCHNVHGDTLDFLENNPNLQTVEVTSCVISRHGLECIAKVTGLRSLTVTLGSDDDLNYLPQLKQLEYVSLLRSHLTGTTLEQLTSLEQLNYLSLRETEITDNNLGPLAELKALTFLDASYTNLGDSGLVAISQIKTLQFLHIPETRVTDSGLLKLASMPTLGTVIAIGTEITPEGVDALRAAQQDKQFQCVVRLQ